MTVWDTLHKYIKTLLQIFSYPQIRNIQNIETADIYFKRNIFLYSLTEGMVASGSKVQGFKWVYTANVELMLNSGNFDKNLKV